MLSNSCGACNVMPMCPEMCPMPCPPPPAPRRFYGLCKGLPAGGVFFYFLVWCLSIISTSIPDWWWMWDSTSGRHEGLWSTCWAHYCIPANQYASNCSSLLNVVRAFSVMTIIFGFFAFLDCLMLFYCITKFFMWGLACGILTFIFSLITWAVYLGFVGQCVPLPTSTVAVPYYPYSAPGATTKYTLGSGWCLAVAVFTLAFVGLVLQILWCLKCRKCNPSCPTPCPCPCPAPVCDPCLSMSMTTPVCDPCGMGAPVGAPTYTMDPYGGASALQVPLVSM